MQWEKKICIRITARRIIVAILIAASSVNLVIVGAALEVASTTTPTPTSSSPTRSLATTFSVPTTTPWQPVIQISSTVETSTPTSSPTFTSTFTATPTSTSTKLPTPTQCVSKSYWPVYYVESGDTLYSLALSIGSSVNELMLANCLPGTLIFSGQTLYVPRLPIKTPIPTWTYTPKPDLPPVVTIIPATVSSTYPYASYDQKLGLWYTYVALKGSAIDSEDGTLPDSSLTWSTNRTDINQNSFLGTGSSIRALLYSNECTGVWHTITLTATDSTGHTAVASVRIFIESLC